MPTLSMCLVAPRTRDRACVSSKHWLDVDHRTHEENLVEELLCRENGDSVDSDFGHEDVDVLVNDGSRLSFEDRFLLNNFSMAIYLQIHYPYPAAV